MKKILAGFAGSIILPLIIVVALASSVIMFFSGIKASDNETVLYYSLSDVVVYEQPVDSVTVPSYYSDVSWIYTARKEIKEIRSQSVFSDTDENTSLSKLSDAKARASAVWLAWYFINDKSIKPNGIDNQYDKYAQCFIDTAYSGEKKDSYSISTSDGCWKKVEDLYGVSINSEIKNTASMFYDELKNSSSYVEASKIGELFEEDKYPENSMFAFGTPEGNAIWNRCFNDAAGGHFTLYSTTNPQCTDFAHWRFYLMYGTDWRGAGNGKDCVDNIVNTFPDENHTTPNGYYFKKVDEPVAGAVFSVGPTQYSPDAGHVGFVEKVDGDYMWFSDGNVIVLGRGNGLRINSRCKTNLFEKYIQYGEVVYALPVYTGE